MVHRIIVGVVWLAAAYLLHANPAGRKVFAFLGAVVALVHLCGGGLGAAFKLFLGRTSVEGGVNLAGFLAGCILGLILGLVAGSYVCRNDVAYWFVQIVAVIFMIFWPLFPW